MVWIKALIFRLIEMIVFIASQPASSSCQRTKGEGNNEGKKGKEPSG
jgi:hypothetical protein